jgi:hypothetical protein
MMGNLTRTKADEESEQLFNNPGRIRASIFKLKSDDDLVLPIGNPSSNALFVQHKPMAASKTSDEPVE